MGTKMRLFLSKLLGILVIVMVTRLDSVWTAGFIVAGFALRIWASGYLSKNNVLAVCGPYRFVRNPLYLGTTLMFIGACFASQKWWVPIIGGILFIWLHMEQIRAEERVLANLFGQPYQDYLKNVPTLLPWKLPAAIQNPLPFSWRLAWKNRIYETFIIIVAFYAIAAVILLLKHWLHMSL